MSAAPHHNRGAAHISAGSFLDGRSFRDHVAAGADMIGPVLVFFGVCVLVATFMFIAHSFLCESEKDETAAPQTGQAKTQSGSTDLHGEPSQEAQWAH
jgi:hypothetical protein